MSTAAQAAAGAVERQDRHEAARGVADGPGQREQLGLELVVDDREGLLPDLLELAEQRRSVGDGVRGERLERLGSVAASSSVELSASRTFPVELACRG